MQSINYLLVLTVLCKNFDVVYIFWGVKLHAFNKLFYRSVRQLQSELLLIFIFIFTLDCFGFALNENF